MTLRASLATLPAIQTRRERVPPGKRKRQALHTVIGGLVFVGAFFLPKFLGFPWQAAIAVAAFGGFIASKDLMVTYLKAIPEAIGAIAGAFTKKDA